MDEKIRKFSNNSSETRSPVLLRRRLSAPETIMRKHVLAMQQSESMDSNETESYTRYRYDTDIGCSDTNLNKQIKKPTLLKRFWNNNNNNRQYSYSRFPGSFYEWQYEKLTSGRSTNSLTSIHSSPEHLIKTQNRRSLQSSPQHRKISPKHDFNKYLTSKRKISVYENSYDNNKNIHDIKSTTNTATNSEFSSDNHKSNFSNDNQTSFEIRKDIIDVDDHHNISNKNLNYNLKPSQYIKYSSNLNDPTTPQSMENTNVNVISNVQLSQTTLDLIFNQIIKDVKNSAASNDNQSTSFYLKQNFDNSQNTQIVKCMISNIGTGSPYSKTDIPIVPRLSALPRTASMEVNMSSNTPTDKESDTSSLADSLEESVIQTTEIINRNCGDNYLIKTQNKPTAFFIPIEIENKTNYKAVSEHLPDKLKDRLMKRQQKREEKLQNRKTAPCSNDSCTKTKKYKPLLPSIKTVRKIQIDNNHKTRSIKNKTDIYNKTKQFSSNIKVKNDTLSPLCTTKSELLCNDTGTKKFYHKTEFNNSNKRIEILEIMECIETANKHNICKNKSKIPILINRLPKIDDDGDDDHNNKIKPTYLDLNCDNTDDPKLDQLIANILIDTLNNDDDNRDEQIKFDKKATKHPSPKYQQKFEVIPEELTLQPSSHNDDNNNNNNNNNNINNNNNNNSNDDNTKFLDQASSIYKGKAAVAVVKDDNIASIPKGWITFYMLHKNCGSPDSTSDEGKDNANTSVKTMHINNNINKNNDNITNKSSNINDNIEIKSLKCDKCGKFDRQKSMQCNNMNNDNKYQQLGEWSVAINGTNPYGQLTPHFEMCFKFPNVNKQFSINKSEITDSNQIRFPKINIDNKNKNKGTADTSSPPHHPQYLPKIQPDKSNSKLIKINDDVTSKFEPRQTRTSLRRYKLSRPKFDYHRLPDT